MAVAAVRAAGTGLFLTSWASGAAVIVSARDDRASRAWPVAASHLAAAATGLLCRAVLPAAPWAIGCALAVAAASDVLHPPAMANAAFAFATPAAWPELLGTAAPAAAAALLGAGRWRAG